VTGDDEKKEIVVRAPSKSVISNEKKVQKATEKALEKERYGIFQVPLKTGSYIGVLSIVVGVLLLSFFAYLNLIGQVDEMLSSNATISVLGLWIAVGLISIITGFFLMGSD
jgi:membrane-anchored glycerophosphoryl diester phosphodiesterase (GDPDase)